MKLEKISSKPDGTFQNIKREAGSVKTGGFASELARIEQDSSRQRIGALMKHVEDQAASLGRKPSLNALIRYRRLISECLAEAVAGSLRREEKKHWDKKGRLKALTIIKQIDDRLDELARLILDGDEHAREILAKLGEIQGLLVDLYT